MVKVLLFAQVRELIGSDTINLTLPASNPSSISASQIKQLVLEQSNTNDTSLQALLEHCMVAIDNEYAMDVDEQITVRQGMEVAIIPPISGG